MAPSQKSEKKCQKKIHAASFSSKNCSTLKKLYHRGSAARK